MNDLLTADDVATYLRLSRRTVYYLAQQGKIPMTKTIRHTCLSGSVQQTVRWTTTKEQLDTWLTANPR